MRSSTNNECDHRGKSSCRPRSTVSGLSVESKAEEYRALECT